MGERRLVDVDDLTSVANHIRTKGGTSSPLEFPSGFNSAVDNIPSGTNQLIDFMNGTITEVVSNDVTDIRPFNFINQTNLVKVSLPNATTGLGASGSASQFSGCTALRHLNLPKITTFTSNNALTSCSSLKVAYLPSKTTTGSSEFLGCTSLEKLIMPKATISIAAFNNCTALKLLETNTARVPNVISSSTLLETFILRRTQSIASLDSVSCIPNDTCEIYVPQALKSTYENATNWSSLTNISTRLKAIEGSPYESLTWYESTQEYRTEVLGE